VTNPVSIAYPIANRIEVYVQAVVSEYDSFSRLADSRLAVKFKRHSRGAIIQR